MADNETRPGASDIAAHLRGNDPLFGAQKGPRVVQLALAVIERNPNQPRKFFNKEALENLAGAIERHGLLQPITVKQIEDSDHYLLVAGERRYRAFEQLGRETIPAIITSGDPDELALIENLHRENLNPVEEAQALKRLADLHSYTQEDLGNIVRKTKQAIGQTLKVLELPEEILKAEAESEQPMPKSILLEIARVKGSKQQKKLYEEARKGQVALTARAAREARLKVEKPKEKPQDEHTKRSEVVQTIGMGRGFAKRLQTISEEYLSGNQAHYAALCDIVRQANETLDALRRNIGEPAEIPVQDVPQEDQAA